MIVMSCLDSCIIILPYTTCVSLSLNKTNRTVAGYAADGFKIHASTQMLSDNQLDNCNGKFTYNSATGKYTYVEFGGALAFGASGTIRAVGGKKNNNGEGAVWMFNLNGTLYNEVAKLVGSGASGSTQAQGTSVALDSVGSLDRERSGSSAIRVVLGSKMAISWWAADSQLPAINRLKAVRWHLMQQGLRWLQEGMDLS